jgi:hypothetical protein
MKTEPELIEPRWEDRGDPYADVLAYVKDVRTRMGHIHHPIPASVAARLQQREEFLHDLLKRGKR